MSLGATPRPEHHQTLPACRWLDRPFSVYLPRWLVLAPCGLQPLSDGRNGTLGEPLTSLRLSPLLRRQHSCHQKAGFSTTRYPPSLLKGEQMGGMGTNLCTQGGQHQGQQTRDADHSSGRCSVVTDPGNGGSQREPWETPKPDAPGSPEG